jgi:hypothetical protein
MARLQEPFKQASRQQAILSLALYVALSSFSSYAQLTPRYVSTVGDFETHVRLHVLRTQRLALELAHSHKELFGSLNDELVFSYMALHDVSKYAAQDGNPTHILRRLYESYGRNFSALPAQEQHRSRALVNELNALDRKVSENFLRAHGLMSDSGALNPKGAALLRLEKIADLVDRGLDPVAAEEFNKAHMERASQFLKDPGDRKLATELEARYPQLVHGLEFQKCQKVFAAGGF